MYGVYRVCRVYRVYRVYRVCRVYRVYRTYRVYRVYRVYNKPLRSCWLAVGWRLGGGHGEGCVWPSKVQLRVQVCRRFRV